jgi:hypothetical protein
MVGSTMKDPAVVAAVKKDFVPILIDFDAEKALVAKHKVRSIPALVWVGPDGAYVSQSFERDTPEDIVTEMEDVLWEVR